MSGLAEPPVSSTPPTSGMPPIAPKTPNGGLPDGIKMDRSHDASSFFEAHQIENGRKAAPAAATPPADVKPPEGAKPVDVPPPIVKKDDVSSKLADSFLPEAARSREPVKIELAHPVSTPESTASGDDIDAAIREIESIEPHIKSSPERVQQFKTLRTKSAQVARDLAQKLEIATKRETELREKLNAAPESEDMARIRSEHEAMSKRLMVLDLQSHPKFSQEFIQPRDSALAAAAELLPGANVAALLNLPRAEFGKAVSEAASKLSAFDQTDFASHMRTAYQLKQRGEQAMGKASEINQALRQQTVNGHKQAFDGTFAKTIGSMVGVKELTVPADATPEQRAEADAFNAGFRNIRSAAEQIALGTSDPEGIARASIKAATYEWQVKSVLPLMAKTIKQKEARVAELEGQIAAIKSRNPNSQMRGVDVSTNGIDPATMNHHDAAEYFATKR